jgi:hypothetical protein
MHITKWKEIIRLQTIWIQLHDSKEDQWLPGIQEEKDE